MLRVPVDIPRDEARDEARRELSRSVYHQDDPNPVLRLLQWLLEKLDELVSKVGGGDATVGYVGLLVIVIVFVLVVVAVRMKLGPLARQPRDKALFGGRELTAAEHRSEAEAFAAAGKWAEAVRERLRAVIRELEQRGMLDPRPGRTADEVAAEAGRVLPDCADELRSGARVFDDVWYGGRVATEPMYAQLTALDDRVRSRRSQSSQVGQATP